MRLFIAIELPRSFKQELARVQKEDVYKRQAQTLGQRYDKILDICHDAARRKAAAVGQFVDDELRDVHTVKIYLANCSVL